MDLLTNENFIRFPMNRGLIEDIEIFGVNRDWFIPFLEEENDIIVNLGDLNQWIGLEDESGLKHVKLEIKFVIVNPKFELIRFNRGYSALVDIIEAEEMELHVTLPLGTKMANNKTSGEITLSKEDDKNKSVSILACSVLNIDRKRRYDFLVNTNHLKTILNLENPDQLVNLNYKVTNEREYYVITVIGLGLFIFAIFRFIVLILGDAEEFDIRYLAAVVAFISLYITILREKYEIPFRKVLINTTVFIGIELIIELIST